MKLFANLYTLIETNQLIKDVSLPHWHCTKIDDSEYTVKAEGVLLTLEGNKELLLFGELNISLAEIDAWVETLAILPISYNIDLHGDEARLIRRYQR
jgi:hypothetical protein